MPLPAPGKTAWPPKAMEKAYAGYSELSAWYGGDPDILSKHYGSDSGQYDRVDTRYRASQFQGGIVGRIARLFWGTPPSPGELRTKIHLPMAEDIAQMSAHLLFGEPPTITVEDKKTQERLNVLIDEGALHSSLQCGAEVDSAMGDAYLVGTWDKDNFSAPWLRVVHADAVVPEFRWGRLTAATIWTTLGDQDNGKVWRHLERHEKGVILNGLFCGNSTELGRRCELSEREETEKLVDEGPTNIDMLTVIHIPNLLPNRLDRSSPLGRSDFSKGVLQLMDALDELWSSAAREFRIAKARVMASAEILTPRGRGEGASIDLDREVFTPFRVPPSGNMGDHFHLIQPLIRVEEHLAGCRAFTDAIINSSGYSTQSFGSVTADVAMTATEIQMRERKTFLTRGSKTLYWIRIREALQMLLAMDREVFGSKVEVERPKIEFGDSIAESTSATAQTLVALAGAEAASTETKVRIVHPEWDDTAVAEEVARIKADTGRSVPDPMALLTAPGDDQEPPAGI